MGKVNINNVVLLLSVAYINGFLRWFLPKSISWSVEAANWAQSSGAIQQNIVVPYYPSFQNPHWGSRYGMVTIVVPSEGQGLGFLFLAGGDTYDGSTTSKNIMNGIVDKRWETGYKNDIWKMAGTEWLVNGDPRLRSNHQKLPQVVSNLRWKLVSAGTHPPPRVTYDQWISCLDYFRNINKNNSCDTKEAYASANVPMWSPRRHHAGLYFNKKLWILGGRAREFVELPEKYSVGGILDPRIRDIYGQGNSEQLFTTQREVSVYKSDVWSSSDGGISWTLVTPGCHAPQASLIADGNEVEQKHGIERQQCTKDSDCYGNEVCGTSGLKGTKLLIGVCVCSMWTPREQHAVAAYGDYMYVSGGYASRLFSFHTNCGPYACGDTDASAYRYYLSDIWRSKDGNIWDLVTEVSFPGRGGHQMLALTFNSQPFLWVIGGRGGSNSFENQGELVYYNDIWVAPLSGNFPRTWSLENSSANNGSLFSRWSPRTGHAVALEAGTSSNQNTRTLFLYGGFNNGTYFDDLWAWRLDDPNEFWRMDFTPAELFSTGSGSNFKYMNNSPANLYVGATSELKLLQRYLIPTKFLTHSQEKQGGKGTNYPGKRLERRPYLTADKIAVLNSLNIITVQDLANIGLYDVLKLRGYDFPQVPSDQRLSMNEICDYRALAIALVGKCNVNLPSLYEGEKNMPWNNHPEFGGPPPGVDSVLWHGQKNYNYLKTAITDPIKLLANWNGCDYYPEIQGLHGPNVNGLGFVSQVQKVVDPAPALQNLFCKQYPGPRAFHVMAMFEERLYIMGGKKSANEFAADTWYRDSKMPMAKFGTTPKSRDTYPWFHFVADKPGVFFEYRVYDPYKYLELRPWSNCTHKTDIGWLNWRKKGPGNGLYRLYVRAVDPAGNRDEKFYWNQNVYEWYYVSPTPWDIIMECVGGFIGLLILAYFEYRRRVKKAAMERYAMKRMRRKFKAMQRDINGKSVDWRTLYMEAKEAEEASKIGKKGKNKDRGKNMEKREKERMKREKEKEKIKKKLKASQDMKKSKKGGDDFVDIMEEGEGGSITSSLDRSSGKSSRNKPEKPARKYDSSVKKKKIAAIDEEQEYEEEEDELMLWEQEAKVNGKLDKEKREREKAKMRSAAKGDVNAGDAEAENDDSEYSTKVSDQIEKKKPSAKKKTTAPPPAGGASSVGSSSQQSRSLTSKKEVSAGELKASAGLEQGAKQRKANKQFQAFEAADVEAKKDL